MKKNNDSQGELFQWQKGPIVNGLYCQKTDILVDERRLMEIDKRIGRVLNKARQKTKDLSIPPVDAQGKVWIDHKNWSPP